MKSIITTGKAALLVLLTLSLAACGGQNESASGTAAETDQRTYEWRMVTAWPKNFPGLGTSPEAFARRVEAMSNGRMRIRVYGAGELVPALEVFDAVSAGVAEIGHSASYYWRGKAPETSFFTTLPFGLNGPEMESWLRHGGGQALWEELYAPFNLIPMSGGHTGVQMGGWFNKEINSVADFRGLTMRVPGLAADVLERLGGVPVNLPGAELYTALQTGVIDATEWVGPYNDLAFGLHDIAEYYYYPGWHEPGSIMEYMFNKERFEALPADLQAILRAAVEASNLEMSSEFPARNSAALTTLVEQHNVDVRPFPDDLMRELRRVSDQVIDEIGSRTDLGRRILASYRAFEVEIREYHRISEEAYTRAREL